MPTEQERLLQNVEAIREAVTPKPGKTFFEEFQDSVVERARGLPLTALIGIPVLFSTLLPLLFKASAEWETLDPAAVFRSFVLAYVTFPLGYLVLRALGFPSALRIVLALLLALLAMLLPFIAAFGIVLVVCAGVAWWRAPRSDTDVIASLPDAAPAMPSTRWHRYLRRYGLGFHQAQARLVAPLLLLVIILLIGLVKLDTVQPSGGYQSLFATSRVLRALDRALAPPRDPRPATTPNAIFTIDTDKLMTDSARQRVQAEITCVQRVYAAGTDSLIAASRKPAALRLVWSASDSTDARLCLASATSTSAQSARDTISRDSVLHLLSSHVNEAAIVLDSLLDYNSTAPDSASQRVAEKTITAQRSLAAVLARGISDISRDTSYEAYQTAELAKATVLAIRATERERGADRAEAVRRRLIAYRAASYNRAQKDLETAFDRIRGVDLVVFGAALLVLLAGQWMVGRQERAEKEQQLLAAQERALRRELSPSVAAVEGKEAAAMMVEAARDEEREHRSRILKGTYPLGMALVLLLLVPLLPKLEADDLNPADPFEAFVQSSWYLPSFVSNHARPVVEPRRVVPGGGEVIYVSTEGAEGDTARLRMQLDSLDSLRARLAARIDSLPDSIQVRLDDSALATLRDDIIRSFPQDPTREQIARDVGEVTVRVRGLDTSMANLNANLDSILRTRPVPSPE